MLLRRFQSFGLRKDDFNRLNSSEGIQGAAPLDITYYSEAERLNTVKPETSFSFKRADKGIFVCLKSANQN